MVIDEGLTKVIGFSFGISVIRQGEERRKWEQGTLVIGQKTEIPKWTSPIKCMRFSVLYTGNHRSKESESHYINSNRKEKLRLTIK